LQKRSSSSHRDDYSGKEQTWSAPSAEAHFVIFRYDRCANLFGAQDVHEP
jgi:hypothetical protein